MNIAFQGETGAYSEEAVSALYPDGIAVPYPSFDAVFEAVATGQADRAVIPIENSLYGSVHQNYDLLREHDLRIRAEVQLRIRHQLLSVHGSSLQSIQTVLSHPQALGTMPRVSKIEPPERNSRVSLRYSRSGQTGGRIC